MTRAEEIATLIYGGLEAGQYRGSELELIEGIVERALAEARRETWEEAERTAMSMMPFCETGEKKRVVASIADLLRAKTQEVQP